ncbi:helicase protein, partial [Opisthorchis viverrini]
SNSSCPSSSIPSPKNRESLAEYRKRLPIWKHRETLIETIQSAQHCIIVSSTGSGKTTQIPQFLLERNLLSNGVVAITQPRRVAAIGVACRVAEELGRGAVGTGPVGYCVRFEDVSDPRTTRIRYMTDGMLLREAILDPDLSRYHYVILDEAHERSLNTDVLFGVVLTAAHRRARAQALSRNSLGSGTSGLSSSDNQKADSPLVQRKPLLPLLKIIIMSATIDPTPFVNFLGAEHTRVVYIEGRPHAIKVLNTSDSITDYVADAAIACIQIHKSKTCPLNRGILIFLTGEEEIMRCCALIHQLARRLGQNGKTGSSTNGSDKTPELLVFPLFAALPQGKQMQALTFSKSDCRKVIVSTNLAETSITIPGIRYVIDSGYAKIKFWDCTTGLETFRVQRISKSQAWQRAGRAGREAPGVCLRLYTDAEYKEMSLHIQPELLRAPLAGVLLNLISMNHKVPQKFPWISRPKEASLTAGVHLLERLGAVSPFDESSPSDTKSVNPSGSSVPLTRQLQLTPLGSIMSAFPLDPRFSRTVLSAAYLGCLIEVLSVISMLYVSPVFYVPVEKREQFGETQERFRHPDGDLASLLQVYRGYVKSSKRRDQADASNAQPSRLTWCRSNFLNRARLETAVRVRSQLKEVAKGAGLTGFLRSCGSELFTITRAFLQAGFKD